MKINNDDLSILVIEKEAIDMYIDFMNLIKKTLKHKEYLKEYTKEELINLLDHKSSIFLFKLNNIVISSSMIIRVSNDTMEIGPQAVFQDLRGNKIQQYMIDKMERFSKSLGYKRMITKLHKKDKISINNYLNKGYKLLKEEGIKNSYYKDI